MSIKLLGISSSLSIESKTEIAVQKSLDFAGSLHTDVDTNLVALSTYDLVFCDGRNPDDYADDSRIVIDKIVEADALIVGSPIYRGTYSGALKNLFDLIPNDALQGKAVGIIATGGSDHHFLAIEHQFKPIFGYFKSYVVPGGVYATNQHFRDGKLSDTGILNRLENLAVDTIRLSRSLHQTYNGPRDPVIERKSLKAS